MSGTEIDALTPQDARRLFGQVLGDAAITEVRVRGGGQLSTVYELRAEPDGRLIVKVYPDEWRWKQEKEVHVYRLLAQHGVGPIPTVLHHRDAGGPRDRAFTVMTLLDGRPLSEVGAELDASAIRRVYRQMGGVLAALHRIEQGAYGYLTTRVLDPEATNTSYMTRQFAKKLEEFGKFGGDPTLREAVRVHVAERVGLFARCPGPTLCHNDFHEGNILVARRPEGWDVTGFIDVENAIAADPLIDLAKTDYYSIHDDSAKRAALVEGYGPLPPDWPERLALYRLYHALELWDWFASIGHSALLPSIAADIRRLAV